MTPSVTKFSNMRSVQDAGGAECSRHRRPKGNGEGASPAVKEVCGSIASSLSGV